MSRRRLRVVNSSSDEEDDEQQRNHNHSQPPQQFGIGQQQAEEHEEDEVQYGETLPDIETVALGSSSGPIQPQLISDDDEYFIDVSDHFSPPYPPPPPHMPSFENSAPASATPNSNGTSNCPVSGVLRTVGLNLRDEWLESCIRGLEIAVPGFSGLDSGTKAKFVFEQFLNSDMNFTGGGVLPQNVDSMHLVELAGPFVLQVDEIINISCPLRERYHNALAGPKRCLKLSMTDGFQRVFGMEYRPIKDLQVLASAGFKVAIKNVVVRRGLILLVPEVLEVLGGSVQELEAARQRLVFEVNKPPRGKRTRRGELPPLATRATLAAWPQNGATNPVQNNSSAQHSNNSTRQDVQGSAPSGAGINTPRTTGDSVVVPPSTAVDELPPTRDTTDHTSTRDSTIPSTSGVAAEDNFGSTVQDVRDVEMDDPTNLLFMLSELPFTYLTILFAKWKSVKGETSQVQGKIKCFLTSVIQFEFRERNTYELRVNVEDGSLITEVLVHHNAVQKAIGYSPEELKSAYTSSDPETVVNAKKTLSNFQTFLVNFEGYLLLEMNESSDIPIAIEMTQGVLSSDACSLLNRCLGSDHPSADNPLDDLISANNPLDPIVLSP